jgi:hypothetical protein
MELEGSDVILLGFSARVEVLHRAIRHPHHSYKTKKKRKKKGEGEERKKDLYRH